MKRAALALAAAISLSNPLQAQINTCELGGSDCVNTVFTAIPFLRITPDARSGGMGDVGVATSPDAASLFYNTSKLAFAEQNSSVGITYTPWLRNLVEDIFIAHVGGYMRAGDLQTFGVSLRYFSLGNISFVDINQQSQGDFNPREVAFDFGYARKLSDNLSTGLTLKYANSNLAGNAVVDGIEIKPANVVAADVSVYYQNDYDFGKLALGASISNIGNKVSYSDDKAKDFIPINLGLGASLKRDIDDYNSITIATDINKLMVPSPVPAKILDANGVEIDNPDFDTDGNGIPEYREAGVLSGMFGSFNDAPGGFKEEMRELMYSVGLEYWYNQQFALRVGHFNEHRTKGNRKYVTFGLGLRYNVFNFNFSYLLSTSSTPNNPLENTLRFSLLFDLDGAFEGDKN